jgi:polo-like kinase 1
MKIVEKKKIIKENLLEQFIREIKIQSFLNHSNIIALYGFFSDEIYFYTLMELGCDGQLYSLILNKKLLSEESTSFIIKNLLEAISYIHENKVLHRDIKPENIVLIMVCF